MPDSNAAGKRLCGKRDASACLDAAQASEPACQGAPLEKKRPNRNCNTRTTGSTPLAVVEPRAAPVDLTGDGENAPVRRSGRERGHVNRFVAGPASTADSHCFESPKFHLVPANGWHRFVWKMGCSALNTIKWNGETPLPTAPCPCWLLPASDEMALTIARLRPQLVAAGWMVLSSAESTIARLSNKLGLREHAEQLGMLDHLPRHWSTPAEAQYPCMLKAAIGYHGKNIHIVNSPEEVDELASDGLGTEWLLQELIPGSTEYSVSLLVNEGAILDSICTVYEYDAQEYVWPNVNELSRKQGEVRSDLIDIMRVFVQEYSGICNFNYKLRADGGICIFEINTRVGADLACDVPRPRAKVLFEKLDALRSLRPR